MRFNWLKILTLSGALLASTLIMHPQQARAQAADAPATTPATTPAAPVAPKAAQTIFETMMGAVEDNNRAAFIASADTRFKTALTPPQFAAVSEQFAPRLKGGHTFTYLGEMNKAGYTVYLWRVRFDDGGDDVLADMSLKDEKVGGFFLM